MLTQWVIAISLTVIKSPRWQIPEGRQDEMVSENDKSLFTQLQKTLDQTATEEHVLNNLVQDSKCVEVPIE